MNYKTIIKSNKFVFQFYIFFSTIFYYIGIIASLISKLLINSIYGVFFAILTLYIIIYYSAETKPYNIYQLIIFLSECSEIVIASMITSTLTVIGFIVGSKSVSNSINKQIMMQMRLEVANGLRELHNNSIDALFDLIYYITKTLNYVDIAKSDNSETLIDDIEVIKNNKSFDLEQILERLIDAYKQFLKFERKHSIIINSLKNIPDIFETSKKALFLTSDLEPENFPDFYNDEAHSIVNNLKKCDRSEIETYYTKIDDLTELIHGNLIDIEFETRKYWIDFSESSILKDLEKYSTVKKMVIRELKDNNEIINKYDSNIVK